jgi:hypothetical protein
LRGGGLDHLMNVLSSASALRISSAQTTATTAAANCDHVYPTAQSDEIRRWREGPGGQKDLLFCDCLALEER